MSIMPNAPAGLSGGNATRIVNTKLRAMRSNMGGNQAAIGALVDKSGPRKVRPKSQVSEYGPGPANPSQNAPGLVGGQPSNNGNQVDAPISANQPLAPAIQQPQQSSPQDVVDKLNRNMAIDKIVSSPEMSETVTRLKLRNWFQNKDPDDGDFGTEALNIVRGLARF